MSEPDVSATTIRLLVFSSPSCFSCPQVKSIVREVVGSGMEDMIHVSEIDITANPAVAERYGIMSVPTLVMNEKVIAHGSLTEDDVRETLWTQLLQEILATKEAYDVQRQTLVQLMSNTLNSMMSQAPGRGNIGDYVHLGVLQQPMFSLMALDPLVPKLLYQAGSDYGLYGISAFYVSMLNPEIDKKMRPAERFPEIVNGIAALFAKNDRIALYYGMSSSVERIDEKSADIRIKGLATSAGAIPLGEPLDHFTAGEMAGVIKAKMGQTATVQETHCYGLGDDFCQFHIELIDDPDEEPDLYPPREDHETERKKRLDRFFGVLNELSLKIWDSVLYKRPIRSEFLDIAHISILQQQTTSLLMLDQFCGSLLYSAGRRLGELGTGTSILFDYIQKDGLQHPLSLGEASRIVCKYLQHPSILLTREHSFVELVEQSYERAVIRISESAHSTGMPNIGKPVCHYTAGYIAGRMRLLMDEDVTVTEVGCIATGKEHCDFAVEKL